MNAKKAKRVEDMVEVHLDCEFTKGPTLVGKLSNDRGQVRFNYDEKWLKNPQAFQLDPRRCLVFPGS
jgi:serine/threonine-protein kinase HipA